MTVQAFLQRYQIHLNHQQQAAVSRTEGPTLVLAVPGSGKTTVLVARLGYLIYGLGVAPERTLTLTYTVSAARDMKARFAALFGARELGRLQFRTINGLCHTIIARYVAVQGRQPFQLEASDGRLSALVRELHLSAGGQWPSDQLVRDVRTKITYCKNMMLTQEEIDKVEVEGAEFPRLYRLYGQEMAQRRLMDFDDQMVIALQILRKHPDLLAQFRAQYHYLSVDEAQDTSKIQHELVALLARPRGDLFLVGDEDQSIYGFRAAWPQALLRFEQDWPGGQVLLMEGNYRCPAPVIQRADRFIAQNQHRRDKHMTACRPGGQDVCRVELTDYQGQYRHLLKIARTCTVPTAILYRNNDSALPLIDLLEEEGIDYTCRQRESFFFTSPIVRDLTSILAFSAQPEDRERFLTFYYKLDLKVKREVMEGLLQRCDGRGSVVDQLLRQGGLEGWQQGRLKAMGTHMAKLPGLTTFAALRRVVKYMGYGDYLQQQGADFSRVDVLLALAREHREQRDLLNRLEQLHRAVEGEERRDAPLILSTIHGAKGLEFDRVILMDVTDGILPAVEEKGTMAQEERMALEEERRLFYVAVTRTRETLEIITSGYRFGDPVLPSTFLRQLMGQEREEEKSPLTLPHARTAQQVAALEKDFIPGAAVVHQAFGPGRILTRSGSIVLIAFDDGAGRKLELLSCLRRNLLSVNT